MADPSYDVPILDNYHAIVSAFGDFLTVAIHQILFQRSIYPQDSFISVRKYNLAVKKSRHQKVCKWIQDAVAAVRTEMLACSVETTSVLIYGPPPDSRPLERYQFSTASFPRIPKAELYTPFLDEEELATDGPENKEWTEEAANPSGSEVPPVPRFRPPPASDLPEQFRATLSRLSCLRLEPLPPDCSFTIMIELRDEEDVDPPISRDQSWIVAEPALQKPPRQQHWEGEDIGASQPVRSTRGRDRGGIKTTPVRKVEAGAFVIEVWVEEGKGKFQARVE